MASYMRHESQKANKLHRRCETIYLSILISMSTTLHTNVHLFIRSSIQVISTVSPPARPIKTHSLSLSLSPSDYQYPNPNPQIKST